MKCKNNLLVYNKLALSFLVACVCGMCDSAVIVLVLVYFVYTCHKYIRGS